MAKEYEITIDDFSGGISDDVRTISPDTFRVSKHFDIFTHPKKLVPYRNTVADEEYGTSTGLKAYKVQDVVYFPNLDVLIGMGRKTDGTGTQIFYKDMSTGVGAWTLGGNIVGNVWPGTLFKGPGNNAFFLADDDVYYATNVGTITLLQDLTTFSATSHGILGRDGNYYIGAEDDLIRIVGVTSAAKVLDLPTTHQITSLATYGNYLAIAMEPDDANLTLNSFVYIWDYTSADVTEAIDWGPGSIKVLENLNGVLVGVSDEYMSSGVSLGAGQGKMVIRDYQGGSPVITKIVEAKSTGGYVRKSKGVRGGALRFAAKVPVSASVTYEGIWAYGSRGSGYANALTLDFIEEDATAGIDAFNQIGNIDYIAHSNDGSVQRTSPTETYTYTSIYESQIYYKNYQNQLEIIELTSEPVPSGGVLTLKYRVDGASSWTTIGTMSTAGQTYTTFTKLASGEDFQKHHEVEFRLESAGGVVPVRIRARYAVLNSSGEDE